MRVVPDQRQAADEREVAPAATRLGGTDIFRGAMVIVVALIIGAVLFAQGLGEAPTTASEDEVVPGADGETAATDPAAGEATSDPATDVGASGDAATDQAADDGGVAGQATGTPTTAPGADATTADPATSDPAAPTSTEAPADPLTTVRPPAEVRVLVLNGAGTQGIAARGTELLQAASYLIGAPKNATANGPSVIYHVDGYQAEALAVAAVFGPGLDTLVRPLDPTVPPVDDTQDAAVIVVIGDDDVIPIP
ncbi:MAG: LytR C-terminal domain-containing protein [Actinomycetota bacterium]